MQRARITPFKIICPHFILPFYCNGKEKKCRNKQFTPSGKWTRGLLDLKSSTLMNELKRYPTSTVLVLVLINPNHYTPHPWQVRTWVESSGWRFLRGEECNGWGLSGLGWIVYFFISSHSHYIILTMWRNEKMLHVIYILFYFALCQMCYKSYHLFKPTIYNTCF